MSLLDKVLTLDQLRDKITYWGHKIQGRYKDDNGCHYLLENGWLIPIVEGSGSFVHILHMEQGFPIDMSRQGFQERGLAVDEEDLQMCINEELIKQIIAANKKRST